VAQRGCRIYEVPISYYGRTYSEGKKIGWKDGVEALGCIAKHGLLGRFRRESSDDVPEDNRQRQAL
jgi:hypothetical protein